MKSLLISVATLGIAPSGQALAHENAELTRIDAQTVEVRRESTRPVSVWASDDPVLDAADLEIARNSGSKTFRVSLPEDRRRYVILRDATGSQTVIAERIVPLKQAGNFRDIGGYPAADGRHVRWGKIYRSGATALLTDADIASVNALGLHEMIDLRSNEERQLAPSKILHVPYSAIGYSMNEMAAGDADVTNKDAFAAAYRKFPAFLAPHARMVFARMLQNGGPLVYNCSAGQDRTGFITGLVLSALGVPRETIIADYHLSATYRRPDLIMPMQDAAAHPDNPLVRMLAAARQGTITEQPLMTADGTAFLAYSFDEIDKRWGSVDAYLAKEVGLSERDIAKLREDYLE